MVQTENNVKDAKAVTQGYPCAPKDYQNEYFKERSKIENHD